jgi:NADH-quinone oxidoreductase subunit F
MADEIDVAMDFDSLAARGTMAGSAGVIVMDETTCMVEALASAAHFFADESCGQCSPCREGTGWILKVMNRLRRGEGRPEDLEALLSAASRMEGKTICVFADAAAWPVQSYITKFRSEFEHHVKTGRCDLSTSSVRPEQAVLLRQACPERRSSFDKAQDERSRRAQDERRVEG